LDFNNENMRRNMDVCELTDITRAKANSIPR
jgi:hypothetical protein